MMRSLAATHRRFVLAYVVLAPLYLMPLAATRFLPAFDLPHHLAIADALGKANQADSPYARDFIVGLQFTPFVAHFIVLRTLALVMSLNLAAKVLIGAVVLALPLATARLLAVTRRDTFAALLAFPIAYSMPLHQGFIAFVCALPLMVWVMAEASNEEGWRERPLRTALSLAVLSLATFFVHLEAWAVAVVAAVAAVLLGSMPRPARVRGLTALAMSLVPPFMYLIRLGNDPTLGASPSFARAVLTARARELVEHGLLADVWGRLRVFPIHLLRGFTDGSDIVASRILLGLIAAGILAGLAAWMARAPRVISRPRPAAGLVAAGLLAYFGLPHHAPPDATTVYPRFAVVVALLLLLAIPAWVTTRADRGGDLLFGLVVLLLCLHGVDLTRHYAAFGRELTDFEQVVAAAPAGLRSGGLVFDADSEVMDVGGIFTGIPAYYVTERPAPTSSTWLYYCMWRQLPCRMRTPGLGVPFFSNPSQFDPRRGLEHLDLVFVRGGPAANRIFGRELAQLRLIANQGRWRAFARIGR